MSRVVARVRALWQRWRTAPPPPAPDFETRLAALLRDEARPLRAGALARGLARLPGPRLDDDRQVSTTTSV